jgi:hypothetical protein
VLKVNADAGLAAANPKAPTATALKMVNRIVYFLPIELVRLRIANQTMVEVPA